MTDEKCQQEQHKQNKTYQVDPPSGDVKIGQPRNNNKIEKTKYRNFMLIRNLLINN